MTFKDYLAKLDNRQYYGLLASVVLLAVVTVVSFILIPNVKAYAAANKASADHPVLPGDSKDLPALLVQRDRTITERTQMLHGDMANLPIREIEAFVIDRLQGIAWNHDVVLQGVKPTSGDTIEAFREILFKLEISGRYEDLFAWLHELRNELGFTVIKEYKMDRVTQTTTDPVLRVQLTIASYRKEKS